MVSGDTLEPPNSFLIIVPLDVVNDLTIGDKFFIQVVVDGDSKFDVLGVSLEAVLIFIDHFNNPSHVLGTVFFGILQIVMTNQI